jgi:hypothetical protein
MVPYICISTDFRRNFTISEPVFSPLSVKFPPVLADIYVEETAISLEVVTCPKL